LEETEVVATHRAPTIGLALRIAVGVGLIAAVALASPQARPAPALKVEAIPTVAVARATAATRAARGFARASRTTSTGISYHNGPVMTAPVKPYVIWYGNWSTNNATAIITDYLNTVSGSPYQQINATYYNAARTPVSAAVSVAATTTDNYSQGKTNLSDNAITAVVSAAISSGRLPADPNGVYFVLTSADVSKSGFLTQYCGWHTASTIAGTTIKYSFVGDPTGPSLANCSMQSSSPNGNPGADAMVSVVAHELDESITDPNGNAWFDSRGYENADKCAWTFGTTYAAANGSLANLHLGSRDFLVQRNWINVAPGGCTMSR
jgi:hypothetical protein